ncbi:RHS repeat domain-containing protein, partial [Chryseobacterium sp. RU33C]|uniref:RHS repeat domain-containing protein n=1 Tax=Chryseobacterium sp. RU33C TaxID=1907398 RepID=UPI00095562A4
DIVTSGGDPGGGIEMMTARAMEPQAFSLEKKTFNPPPAKTPDLQFFPTSEGFYDYQKNQYIYQYKDHLGNVRVSFAKNSTGVLEIVDNNDYYPFGMNHLKTGSAYFGQDSFKKYKYNGKELQETGMYDYGARMYMPDIGRWGVIDPKAELLESSSPYVYALNSPILYIDKDGELPILINGRVADGDQDRANPSYWTQSIINTIKGSGIPNPGGQFHYVDGDRYAGQSFFGDWSIKKGGYLGGNTPTNRMQAGRMAMNDAEFNSILSKLARDPKTGKIIEKIQIYTHSRGAAFGAGYTERLLQKIKEHASEFADSNNVVDFVFNMAPHQSNSIDAPDGVDSYSIDHKWDVLSGNDMQGLKGAFRSNEKVKGAFGSHSINSFQKDIQSFTSAFLKSGSSNQVINNFIQEMKKKYNITVTVTQ